MLDPQIVRFVVYLLAHQIVRGIVAEENAICWATIRVTFSGKILHCGFDFLQPSPPFSRWNDELSDREIRCPRVAVTDAGGVPDSSRNKMYMPKPYRKSVKHARI